MKKLLIAATLSLTALAATPAMAHSSFDLNLGIGGPVFAAPAPVVYAPPPVAYYPPAPVAYYPPPPPPYVVYAHPHYYRNYAWAGPRYYWR